MKFSVVLLSCLAVAASAAKVENTYWYYPFWRQSCTGCKPMGNSLPWCVKVPVNNLICTSKRTVFLPSCTRVMPGQIFGPVDRALKADNATRAVSATTAASADTAGTADIALSLDDTATVNPAQLLCPLNAPKADLGSCVTIPATQITQGALPQNVTVPVAQVTGPGALANSITVNASSVNGILPASTCTSCFSQMFVKATPTNCTAAACTLVCPPTHPNRFGACATSISMGHCDYASGDNGSCVYKNTTGDGCLAPSDGLTSVYCFKTT